MGETRPFDLRPADAADADAIGALHVASWRETYAGLLPEARLASLSVPERIAMWRSVLADADAHRRTAVFLAEAEGRLVGFGACGRQRDAALAAAGYGGEIGALYVLRAYQQCGAGRALMAALAGALAGFGHRAASLWVLRDNAPARAFYEALGGQLLGEKEEEGQVELAYGWRDLSRLADQGGAA